MFVHNIVFIRFEHEHINVNYYNLLLCLYIVNIDNINNQFIFLHLNAHYANKF